MSHVIAHEELKREIQRVEELIGQLESTLRIAKHILDEETRESVVANVNGALDTLREAQRDLLRQQVEYDIRH